MKASLAEFLVNLELRLHDPEVRRSSTNMASLLADDFIEFGSSGRVHTKSGVVAALVAETPTAIRAHDFVVKQLAPGVALLTYRTTTEEVEALRSSIWVESAAGWQIVFHQGTPA